MAAKCSTSMSLCAARFTRLDPTTGFLAPGPNNSYVTTQTISLGFDPVVSEGEDRELRGSCDCMIVQFKANDILKRWNLTLNMGQREPGLEELLTGAAAIHAQDATLIGANHVAPLACGANPPAVAVEGWSKAMHDDAQRGDWPWIRWVWLYSIWAPGGGTLEAGFQQPAFTGSSRSNPQLDLDAVYGDFPAGVANQLTEHGGWFHDTFKPASTDCNYAAASSS
jgi:hypothetical protein